MYRPQTGVLARRERPHKVQPPSQCHLGWHGLNHSLFAGVTCYMWSLYIVFHSSRSSSLISFFMTLHCSSNSGVYGGRNLSMPGSDLKLDSSPTRHHFAVRTINAMMGCQFHSISTCFLHGWCQYVPNSCQDFHYNHVAID